MKKIFFIVLSVVLLMTGCSLSKEEITKDNLTIQPGHFNILIVTENKEYIKNTNLNVYKEISNSTVDRSEIKYYVIWTWDRGDWNYTKAYNIEKYPTFLVFDYKDLVLQTTDITELKEFFATKQ